MFSLDKQEFHNGGTNQRNITNHIFSHLPSKKFHNESQCFLTYQTINFTVNDYSPVYCLNNKFWIVKRRGGNEGWDEKRREEDEEEEAWTHAFTERARNVFQFFCVCFSQYVIKA